jgi:inositol-hexakisphosphate 5-kinase
MLEDLTFPFREGRPCVLDVKMGTRQYRANASPEKEQRQRLKSSTTTTGQYGLRLNGMQVRVQVQRPRNGRVHFAMISDV